MPSARAKSAIVTRLFCGSKRMALLTDVPPWLSGAKGGALLRDFLIGLAIFYYNSNCNSIM
jgi:hypothetical protein